MKPYVFGPVTWLTAVAQGQPGQRTFYVQAGKDDLMGRFWLEKEQLLALATGIDRLLAALEAKRGIVPVREDASCLDPAPDVPPTAEFKIGQLSLAYDEGQDMVALLLGELDAPDDETAATCWASRAQMRAFSRRIVEVCAAGRPVCPLCSGPVNPEGHVCPRSNGHREIQV